MKKLLLRACVAQDLARSGLNENDRKKLGIEIVRTETVQKLTNFTGTAAYRIPYFDLQQKKTKLYRLRFLDPVLTSGIKYWQPPKTIPQLYFAPYFDWQTVAKNPEETLYITEGEKKAARACKDGIKCIGLGGVWSWRAAKQGVLFLEDFKKIEWKGRAVVIIFDSDISEKIGVQQAMQAFSRELIFLGATPFTIKLNGKENAGKIGLDDFLEAHGIIEFNRLPREQLLGALGEQLWQLNEEIAYIEASDTILRIKDAQLLTPQSLVTLSYANRRVTIVTTRGTQQVSVAAEWLKWPFRRMHRALSYAPGNPNITEKNEFNIWPGWGVQPKFCKLDLWGELIEYVFKGAEKHKRWFLQWLSYPLQNPGAKMYTSVVLYSRAEGVGKSLIGLTLGKIYGKNFAQISQEELQAPFNDWAVGKQFILGDDVTGSDKRRDADRLKLMVSREILLVHKKYQPRYPIIDCINYLFTTNQPDAFFLGQRDRRFFIHEIENDPLSDAFYKEYDQALWYGDLAAGLFDMLLKFDLTGFNPKAHAPESEAKTDMVELSRSDVDTWVDILSTDPYSILKIDNVPIKRVLWTTNELVALYDPLNQKKTHTITMAKALRRAGFKPLPVTTTKIGAKRLWAVAEQRRWVAAEHHERAEQYIKERGSLDEKKVKY